MNSSETKQFTKCFEGEDQLIKKTEKWRKVLNNECSKACKKIRIKDRNMEPISKKMGRLIDKRNNIIRVGCVCWKSGFRMGNLNLHTMKYTERIFCCEECEKNFTPKCCYQVHMKKKHKDKKDNLICEPCGKQFERKKV